MKSLGYEVVRFTYRQVSHGGKVAARQLRSLLGGSRAPS
jgi:hypothetical protein